MRSARSAFAAQTGRSRCPTFLQCNRPKAAIRSFTSQPIMPMPVAGRVAAIPESHWGGRSGEYSGSRSQRLDGSYSPKPDIGVRQIVRQGSANRTRYITKCTSCLRFINHVFHNNRNRIIGSPYCHLYVLNVCFSGARKCGFKIGFDSQGALRIGLARESAIVSSNLKHLSCLRQALHCRWWSSAPEPEPSNRHLAV